LSKACMKFWREAWLRKVNDVVPRKGPDFNKDDSNQLRARLKTRGPKVFFVRQVNYSKRPDRLSAESG